MCNDFLRLGYTNFVLDPGVRVTYWTWMAEHMKNATYLPIPQTTWADVQASPVDPAMTVLRPNVRCCAALDSLSWGTFCRMSAPVRAQGQPLRRVEGLLHARSRGPRGLCIAPPRTVLSPRCCPLKEGERYIQWAEGYDTVCKWENYMVPNHTAASAAEALREQQHRHRHKRLSQAAAPEGSGQ